MRGLATWISMVSLAIALGAIGAGIGVILPALTNGTGGVDPNLARAWIAPMCIELGTVALVASVLVALATPRSMGAGMASTLGLVAAALCILDRAVVLPRLTLAWTLVDLTQAAPEGAMAEVQQLTLAHQAAGGTAAVLMLVLIALQARSALATEPAPAPIAP